MFAVVLAVILLGCSTTVSDSPQNETDETQNSTGIAHEPTPTETVPSQTEPDGTQPVDPDVTCEECLIGDLYITTSGSLSSTYTQARVRAEFPGYDIEEQTVRIKYRGNSSLSADKKSYNIKFEQKVSLFGMEAGKKWCLIADPFDKSLLRPTIGFEYASAIGIPYTSQTRLCLVWLNGEYMGVYTAIEPVDDGKNLVDIDVDAGDFLFERNHNSDRTEEGVTYFTTSFGMRFELNVPEEPDQTEKKRITSTVSTIESAIRSMDHTKYERYIDVSSFVDFYIFNEVIKDIDFGRYSTRYYVKNGILYAGPPWDLDLSMGNVSGKSRETTYRTYHNLSGYGNGSGDSAEGFWCEQKDFYRWLCQDDYFMDLVRTRWAQLKSVTDNLVIDNDLGQNRIDMYLSQISNELKSNYTGAGWSVSTPDSAYEYHSPADDYTGNVELLRQWLIRRINWLDEQWSV